MPGLDQATKLMELARRYPLDRLIVLAHVVIIIGGGYYVLNYSIPSHIKQLTGDLNAAVRSFEADTQADNKRTDKLIEILERRMDADDRNRVGSTR